MQKFDVIIAGLALLVAFVAWKWPKQPQKPDLSELVKLRSDGVMLRNENISLDQIDDWKARYEIWRAKTNDAANRLSKGLMARLEPLNVMSEPLPANKDWLNEDHHLHLRCLNEKLARIEAFIKDNE